MPSSEDPKLIPVLERDNVILPLALSIIDFKSIPPFASEKVDEEEDVFPSDPLSVNIIICPWSGKSPMFPNGPTIKKNVT